MKKKDNKIMQILNFFYSIYLELPIHITNKEHYKYLQNNWNSMTDCYQYSINTFFCASSQQFHTYSKDINFVQNFYELGKCEFCSDLEKYNLFIEQNYNNFVAASNIPKLDKKKRFDKYMDLLSSYANAESIIKEEVFLLAFVSENYPNLFFENYDYFIFNPSEKLEQFHIAFISDFHIHDIVPVNFRTYAIFKEKQADNYIKHLKAFNQKKKEHVNKYLKLYKNYLERKENDGKPKINKPKRDWKDYKIGDIVLTRNSHDFGEIIKIEETKNSAIFSIFEKETNRKFNIHYRNHFENVRLKSDNYSLFTKKEWVKFFINTWNFIKTYSWLDPYYRSEKIELNWVLGHGKEKNIGSALFFRDENMVTYISPNVCDLMVLSYENDFHNKIFEQEFITKFFSFIKRLDTNIPYFLNHLRPQLEKKKTEYIEIITEELKEKEQQNILQSKFGGNFYMPQNTFDFSDFNPLAQINFAELPKNDLFPTSGILQFYFSHDWLLTEQNSLKVMFFEEDDFLNTTNLFIVEKLDTLLIKSKQKLHFIKLEEYQNVCYMQSFGNCGNKFKEVADNFFKQPYMHKMGGNSCFVNDGFHISENDILLLQIVDDVNISIADGGAIYLYINKDALKNREFDKVKFAYDSL